MLVERIEELEAELEVHPLGQQRVLGQCKVEVLCIRASQI